ncbi:MAG TPA: hypothetical protein PK411_16100, partial [Mesotoga infera]|nr:hypothetical protein [Mesotoga infera]HPD39869.1 hypothetical protein [Mesotoga infera]
ALPLFTLLVCLALSPLLVPALLALPALSKERRCRIRSGMTGREERTGFLSSLSSSRVFYQEPGRAASEPLFCSPKTALPAFVGTVQNLTDLSARSE